MIREQKLTGIILKKQPFGEADEIITFFSKERGKVRGLAKSVKLAKSKLQSRLQLLFLARITLAGGQLPKITGAETAETYHRLRENLPAVKMAFYASELLLKFTPDEQPNEALFNLKADFLRFLDAGQTAAVLGFGLAKFKIDFLETVGLGVRHEPEVNFFSNHIGGFVAARVADAVTVDGGVLELFRTLRDCRFDYLANIRDGEPLGELQHLLSGFIEYQLERAVKSERFLEQ